MLPIKAFQGEEHARFLWPGNGSGVAILVHGFPGTPAEMRPIAELLHAEGWTVEGVLLPGFGPDIESLPKRHWSEWAATVKHAVITHRRTGQPLMLVGHSMGGALALTVAAQTPIHALLLTAPFSTLDNVLFTMLPVLRVIFPEVKPFRLFNLDFNNPEVRAGIRNFMPDIDLDDPETQAAIREYRLPLTLFDQIRQVGKAGQRAASQIKAPTLILQGLADELVRPASTRRLVSSFGGPVQYVEMPGEHNINLPESSSWAQVTEAIRAFARKVLAEKAAQ